MNNAADTNVSNRTCSQILSKDYISPYVISATSDKGSLKHQTLHRNAILILVQV